MDPTGTQGKHPGNFGKQDRPGHPVPFAGYPRKPLFDMSSRCPSRQLAKP